MSKAPLTFIYSAFLIVAMTTALGCGRSDSQLISQDKNSNIIGGQVIDPNDPLGKSIVGLTGTNTQTDQGFSCTGALISPHAVLTAAHCVLEKDSDLKIIFATDLSTSRKSLQRLVLKTIIHPDFVAVKPILDKLPAQRTIEEKRILISGWNDLALLSFKGRVPEGFNPIQILDDESKIKNGAVLSVFGFGEDDESLMGVLRKAKIAIYKSDFNPIEFALDQRQGKGICRGDSGGPAFLKTGFSYKLAGIASHGITNDEGCNGFSAFTNLTALRGWIRLSLKQIQ